MDFLQQAIYTVNLFLAFFCDITKLLTFCLHHGMVWYSRV